MLEFDIADYLHSHGLQTWVHGKNVQAGWINIQCLWCDDHSNHLGINPSTWGANCWRCGKKSLFSIVARLEKSREAASEILSGYLPPAALENDAGSGPSGRKKALPAISFPSTFSPLTTPEAFPAVERFLKKRGLPPRQICQEYGLLFGGNYGDFQYRLIIPIYVRGKLMTYLGRTLFDHPIPYKNLGEEKSTLPAKQCLYGVDEIHPGSNVVIVEGPIDRWKLGRGAVSTLGIMWTKSQVALLRDKNPNKVFIMYDNEPQAQEQAEKLAGEIWFCPCEIVALDGVKDPGELSMEEGKSLMKELV